MMVRSLLLAVAAAGMASPAAAAPYNDRYDHPIRLVPGVGVYGTLDGAGPDAETLPFPGVDGGPTVWYRVVAPAQGIYVVDTSGSKRSDLRLRILDDNAGSPLIQADGVPTPLGERPSTDPVTFAFTLAEKGADLRIAVIAPPGTLTPDPDTFRLNVHQVPTPTDAARNLLVVSPDLPELTVELGPGDTFSRLPLQNVLTFAPVHADKPVMRTGIDPARLAVVDGRPEDTAIEAGEALGFTAATVGAGPFAGRVGRFIRTFRTEMTHAGDVWGHAATRVLFLRRSGTQTDLLPTVTLDRRSDVGRIGTARRFTMTAHNATPFAMTACLPIPRTSFAAHDRQSAMPNGADAIARAFDPATGKPLAPAGTPVRIAPGATVRFDVTQTIAGYGFHLMPLELVCANPAIRQFQSGERQLPGADYMVSYGYAADFADAVVAPKSPATDAPVLPPKGVRDLLYTVHNTGKARALTVRVLKRLPGAPANLTVAPPVKATLCLARGTGTGACTTPFTGSVTVQVPAGATRSFRVRLKTDGSPIPSGSAMFVVASLGTRVMGVAGFAPRN